MATWSSVTTLEAPGSRGGSAKAVCATTEAVPTTDAEGVSLASVAGFKAFAECDEGQTFTGTGSFDGVQWGRFCGWARDGNLDVAVPSWAAGSRRIALGDFPVSVPAGRVALLPNAVGVSGGSITVYYDCVDLLGWRW